MNSHLRWYRRVVAFGIAANMSFALAALYAPGTLLRIMGLRQIATTIWLRNVGMLLLLVSMFNAGAAVAPRRYPLYSWFVPIARLIAGLFFFRVSFFNPLCSSERPKALFPLFAFDSTMGLVCGLLLQRGLPPESRLSSDTLRRLARRSKARSGSPTEDSGAA